MFILRTYTQEFIKTDILLNIWFYIHKNVWFDQPLFSSFQLLAFMYLLQSANHDVLPLCTAVSMALSIDRYELIAKIKSLWNKSLLIRIQIIRVEVFDSRNVAWNFFKMKPANIWLVVCFVGRPFLCFPSVENLPPFFMP